MLRPVRTRSSSRRRAQCSAWTIVSGFVGVVVTIVAAGAAVSALKSQPLCNWGKANLDPLEGVNTTPDFTCPSGIFPVSRQEALPLSAEACEANLDSKYHQLDLNAQLLYQVLSRGVLDAQGATPNGTLVPKPVWHRRLKKQMTVFGVPIPVEDEDAGTHQNAITGGVQDFAQQMLRSRLVFGDAKDTDMLLPFDDAKESSDMLAAATRAKTRLPPAVIPWGTMLTDEAAAKVAFVGLGAHAIAKVTPEQREAWAAIPHSPGPAVLDTAVFVSDFTWMAGVEVRNHYEPFGAAAVFDAQGDIMGVVWNAHPEAEQLLAGAWVPRDGSPLWDHAKFVWRSSLVVGVTLRDHLVGLHATLSNAAVTATRENLPTTHPIRRLMTPFTFRTVWINKGSISTLLSRNGMLHRAVGLSWAGMKQAFRFAYKNVVFTSATEQIKSRGMDDVPEWLYPWGADTRRFDAIVHAFVSRYVQLYYGRDAGDCAVRVRDDEYLMAFDDGLHAFSHTMLPHIHDCDSLVEVLSTIIVKVTASHLQFGRVSAYVADASWAASKLEPFNPRNTNLAGIQTAFQMNGIAMITAKAQPMLLSNFDHLLVGTSAQVASAKASWGEFRDDLCRLSNAVDQQNAQATQDPIKLLPLAGKGLEMESNTLAAPEDGKPRRFPCNSVNPKFMSSAVSI